MLFSPAEVPFRETISMFPDACAIAGNGGECHSGEAITVLSYAAKLDTTRR
jgi:hypothetical protein